MKFTEKGLNEEYQIVQLSYCAIQDIEPFLIKIGYTCGLYGWKSDIYISRESNIALSTGYSPVKGYYPSSRLTQKFIIDSNKLIEMCGDYDVKKAKIRALFDKFLKDAILESKENA